MKPHHAASAPFLRILLVLLMLGGCRIRVPTGGCPYDEVEVSPDLVTPWDTLLTDDVDQLQGPFLGALTWLDGGGVVTVPKAGTTIDVEAMVTIDLPSARMIEYTGAPDRKAMCEPDRLVVDAEVSFIRLEDREVELRIPITVFRDSVGSEYRGEAETTVEDFASDIIPIEEHELEAILTTLWWVDDASTLHGEVQYRGKTSDSPTAGHGSFKTFLEFKPAL